MTIVTKNMKDVKMAKPFRCLVPSFRSDLVMIVELEKEDAVGET